MTGAANVYGQALYDLAQDEGLSTEILEEMKALQEAFATAPDFIRLLSSPSLSREERLRILDDSFSGRVHTYLLSFMKLLTEKGYMRCFMECCAVYRNCYNHDNGILPVKAVSAVALEDGQASRLCAKLEKITGKKIELTNVIDPACIGGMRLDYDGMRVDDTVRSRLDRLHGMLKSAALE